MIHEDVWPVKGFAERQALSDLAPEGYGDPGIHVDQVPFPSKEEDPVLINILWRKRRMRRQVFPIPRVGQELTDKIGSDVIIFAQHPPIDTPLL
jgi:hypothetical protein